MDSSLEVVGYRICGCGDYVLELEFLQLGGQCWICYETSPTRERRTIEVLHRGTVSTVRIPKPRRKENRGSRGSRSTRQIRKYADRAAVSRLKLMFPDAYQLLYTEERIRRGLPVVPRRGTMTEPDPAAYDAATDRRTP